MLPQVAIVGAGILGVSTAFHLSALGVRPIVVIDRRCLSAGATGRSGALVRSNYDNSDDARLALLSLEVFRDWKGRVGGSCDFQPVGLLELGKNDPQGSFADLVARQHRWGVKIGLIDAAEAARLAPWLCSENLSGPIAYEAGAGCCDPNLANHAMYQAARARGVKFIFDEPVTGIVVEAGKAIGLKTARRMLAAGTIVVAAGAWTNELLGPLHLNFGFKTRLSRLAVFRPPEFCDRESFPAIIDGVQEAWFRPMHGGGVLVGAERGGRSGIDPNQIPDVATQRAVEDYRKILAYRFAVSPHAAPRGSWAGAYMMSSDRRPVVGKASQISNLFLACGDSGTSFKISPALGLGLAEQIAYGEERSVGLASLSPSRFELVSGNHGQAGERPSIHAQ